MADAKALPNLQALSRSPSLAQTLSSKAVLQQSEECFRLIVDSIPGFVCTLNAAGEVELLNRQLLEYFGKTAEELKNWSTSDAVHPDDLPRVMDAWRHSVETGQPYDCRYQPRFDGSRCFRGISRGPLLQAECFPGARPSASEPKGRHSDAGRVLREALCRESGEKNQQDR
jgi:PAS domain S-box-containing protein